VALGLLPCVTKAAAAPPAAEVRHDHSTVRLLDGGEISGRRMAGIAVFLNDGWKTYWRVPGDSGMPPSFDFSRSQNLKSVRVLWPAPSRFADPELGETIGYKGEVVFPLVIEPEDPARPVRLHLVMDYALCSDICIPARAELVRVLPPAGAARPDPAERALIKTHLARVPRREGSGPVITRAYVRPGKGRPELVVHLKGDGLDEKTDILVEGPVIASFCHPRYLGPQEDGSIAYFLPVDGIQSPEDLLAADLTLTILAGETRVERKIRLQ
jgi:DsbC/DsbD-like thiol-disulfide interchange protein